MGDRRGRDDLEDEDSDDDIVAMTTQRNRKKERLSTVEQLSRRRQMKSQLSDSDSDESGGELDPYSQQAIWDDESDGVLHYRPEEDDEGGIVARRVAIVVYPGNISGRA